MPKRAKKVIILRVPIDGKINLYLNSKYKCAKLKGKIYEIKEERK